MAQMQHVENESRPEIILCHYWKVKETVKHHITINSDHLIEM